jgi:hypothetical protein
VGYGLGNLGEIQDEPSIVASQSKKTVNLEHRLGRLPIEYILHFARVNGYSVFRNHMPMKPNLAQPKLTFVEFCIELIISQSVKHNAKMSLMLFNILGID